MFVGSVNVGIARSTRSLSGATGTPAGTIGCGIVAGSGAEGDVVDGVADPAVPSGLAVHAPTNDAATMMPTINRQGRSVFCRDVPSLIGSSFA